MAEYYFDYKLKVLKNDLKISTDESKHELPVLHLERNYKGKTSVEMSMYLTIPQWLAGQDDPTGIIEEAIIVYDSCGVDTSLVDETYRHFVSGQFSLGKNIDGPSAEFKDRIEYSQYKRNGYRYVFSGGGGGNDFSGVGMIVLKGRNGAETSMYCMVNFGFKKKIGYTIKDHKIKFEKVALEKLPKIQVTIHSGRYPCLRRDQVSTFTLIKDDLRPGDEITTEAYRDSKLHVCLADAEDEKYYLLECLGNDTVLSLHERETTHVRQFFCPYCHGEIKPTAKNFMKLYRRGGVSCQGGRVQDSDKHLPIVIESDKAKGKPAKDIIYCAEDFTRKGEGTDNLFYESAHPRILPESFLDHDHFKILVLGSKRSGKTTFISRLFDIVGTDTDLDVHGYMLESATMGKGSMRLEKYNIKAIKTEKTRRKIGDPWCKDNSSFYSKYSIDIDSMHFPGATDLAQEGNMDKFSDLRRLPFVMEANRSAYVYFYDMAGEDAQKRTEIMASIAGAGELGQAPVGVFYLIDKDAKPQEIRDVRTRLTEMARGRKVPLYVAIILTKFDAIEAAGEFDANCHCLRNDVTDMLSSSYEGSSVITNINLASEEIRAYLSSKDIEPQLEDEVAHGRMVIKYFGVSSFAASDAIHHENAENGKSPLW